MEAAFADIQNAKIRRYLETLYEQASGTDDLRKKYNEGEDIRPDVAQFLNKFSTGIALASTYKILTDPMNQYDVRTSRQRRRAIKCIVRRTKRITRKYGVPCVLYTRLPEREEFVHRMTVDCILAEEMKE